MGILWGSNEILIFVKHLELCLVIVSAQYTVGNLFFLLSKLFIIVSGTLRATEICVL